MSASARVHMWKTFICLVRRRNITLQREPSKGMPSSNTSHHSVSRYFIFMSCWFLYKKFLWLTTVYCCLLRCIKFALLPGNCLVAKWILQQKKRLFRHRVFLSNGYVCYSIKNDINSAHHFSCSVMFSVSLALLSCERKSFYETHDFIRSNLSWSNS